MKKLLCFLLCLFPSVIHAWFGFSVVYDNPSWSPDSLKLVFEENNLFADRYDTYYLRIRSVNGDTDRRLTSRCDEMNVSPDTRYVILNNSVLLDCEGNKGMIDYLKDYNYKDRIVIRRTAWAPKSKKFAFVIVSLLDNSSQIGIYDIEKRKSVIIAKDAYAYDDYDNDFLRWVDGRILFTTAEKAGYVKTYELMVSSVGIDGKNEMIHPEMKVAKHENMAKKSIPTKDGVLFTVEEDKAT